MTKPKMFETLADLKPFVFRITDNGGQTADRYTVVTCDGDYWSMSSRPFHPQGVGLTGERLDPMGLREHVEAGIERDIRWIDLPEDCRRCVMGGLNQGFEDWLAAEGAALGREFALNFEGWDDYVRTSRENVHKGFGPVEAIYRDGEAFRVRMDDRFSEQGEDPGPYATYRDAALTLLPNDYDLSGPEYHVEIDMWDETGGAVDPWDRTFDPPLMEEQLPYATAKLTGPAGSLVGFFEDTGDAFAYIDKLEREAAAEEPRRTFVRASYAVHDLSKDAA